MLFVVDIGNSHTVTAVYQNDELLGHWRLTSDRNRTVDEIGMRYTTLFSMIGLEISGIEKIVISSVVPTLETAWVECCKKYFSAIEQQHIFVVSHQTVEDLVTVMVDNPSEVGADRLVNAIAAWYAYQSNVMVIDFGTAITFDCVASPCQYLGGAIVPGMNLSLDALSSKTAKLPHIDISSPPANVVGKNTIDAMKSGVLFGYGAMIDGLVKRMWDDLQWHDNGDLSVIATGGGAALIAPYSEVIDKVEPLLTLKGLKTICDRTTNGF